MKKTTTYLILALLLSIISTESYSQAPDWQWAVKAGANNLDGGNSIALRPDGWMWVTGRYTGRIDFNSQIGFQRLNGIGSTDMFLVLFDDLGYARKAIRGGGSGVDQGRSVVMDGAGNVYVAGIFNGTANFGGSNITTAGYNDIFVVKYDTAGALRWQKKIGGTGFENNPSLAIRNNNLFISGNFQGTANFDSLSISSAGSDDIFIARMDTAGNFAWVKKAGGISSDIAGGITVDNNSNVYITGRFSNIATFDTTQIVSAGGSDGFVAKYNSSGTNLWVNRFGGRSFESGYAIAASSTGNVHITGTFEDTLVFGSTTLISAGSTDLFTAKYTTAGVLSWVRRAGGSGSESGTVIGLESNGSVIVSGSFRGKMGFGTDTLTSAGGEDIFIVKYNSSGTKQWQRGTGGTLNESPGGVAIDPQANMYFTGSFRGSVDFGATTLASTSNSDDFFLGRVSTNPLPVSVPEAASTSLPVSVYPNPSRGNITLYNTTGQPGTLVIYSITGMVIKKLQVSNSLHNDFLISDLSNGMYLGVFTYGSSQLSFKLIKE